MASDEQVRALLQTMQEMKERMEKQDETIAILTSAAGPASGSGGAASGAAAGPGLSALDITNAVLAGQKTSKDHSGDLKNFDAWTGEAKDPHRAVDIIKRAESRFDLKSTPEDKKVPLFADLLTGTALATWKVFTNAAGHKADPKTTTWAEFRSLMLTLQPDEQVECKQIQKDYNAIHQRVGADKYVEEYRRLVVRIDDNATASTLYTRAGLLAHFLDKLKPAVQVSLAGQKFSTLDEAYSAAIGQDKLLFLSGSAARDDEKKRSSAGSPWRGNSRQDQRDPGREAPAKRALDFPAPGRS